MVSDYIFEILESLFEVIFQGWRYNEVFPMLEYERVKKVLSKLSTF